VFNLLASKEEMQFEVKYCWKTQLLNYILTLMC